jgi:hypothetical protein
MSPKMTIVVALTLACVGTSALARMPTAAEQSIITAAVKSGLVDPDSAQFTFTDLGKDQPQFYCAYVNAKNRMGGYDGRHIFEVMMIWRNGKLADALDNGVIQLSAFDSDPRMRQIDVDKLTKLCPDQVDQLQF